MAYDEISTLDIPVYEESQPYNQRRLQRMAIIAKIYKGSIPSGQYQVGCVDDRGYVYKGQTAVGNYLIGCVDNNGRIYNSQFTKGNYLIGCSDNKGNVYKNDHASTSASYLVGKVVSNGNLGRVYKKTSSASVATIEGSNHIAGAMAFLLLLNSDSNVAINSGAIFAGVAATALLLSSDEETEETRNQQVSQYIPAQQERTTNNNLRSNVINDENDIYREEHLDSLQPQPDSQEKKGKGALAVWLPLILGLAYIILRFILD